MPITAIALCAVAAIGVLLSWCPWPVYRWRGRSTAGPSHYRMTAMIHECPGHSFADQIAEDQKRQADGHDADICHQHGLLSGNEAEFWGDADDYAVAHRQL